MDEDHNEVEQAQHSHGRQVSVWRFLQASLRQHPEVEAVEDDAHDADDGHGVFTNRGDGEVGGVAEQARQVPPLLKFPDGKVDQRCVVVEGGRESIFGEKWAKRSCSRRQDVD